MMFFQTLLKRDDNEITKKVYICQKNKPVKGDWVELLAKDFTDIDMSMNEDIIKNETKAQFKSRINKQLEKHMLAELKHKQEGHSKICDICYKNFTIQEYLKSHMFNNHEALLLFSLRSRNCKSFKANVPYYKNQVCPNNGCEEIDSQEHCIECDKLFPPETRTDKTEYSDIFSNDVTKQLTVTKLYSSLLERREVASANSTGLQCCPGFPRECSDLCSKL